MLKNAVYSMGVLNRTPNSFSDGNQNLDLVNLKKNIESLLLDPNLILDIGFESTAPMNQGISHEEECQRFDDFLRDLKELNINLNHRIISLDTYKIESFKYFKSKLKEIFPDIKYYIFNDVSGVLDHELEDLLASSFFNDCFYVYNFTNVPSRLETCKHMTYVENLPIMASVQEYYQNGLSFFQKINVLDRIIFDLGFGFSKSYEQNIELLERIPEIFLLIKSPILVGLSKKSFLRKKLNTDSFEESELLHFYYLKMIINSYQQLGISHQNPLIIRLHNPLVLAKAQL